jgi:hypothetical protein
MEEAKALLKEAKLMKMSAWGWASAAATVEGNILITISFVPKNALVVPTITFNIKHKFCQYYARNIHEPTNKEIFWHDMSRV